jgi:hypothetical protein
LNLGEGLFSTTEVPMPDMTVKSINDMEAIYGGLARRAPRRR